MEIPRRTLFGHWPFCHRSNAQGSINALYAEVKSKTKNDNFSNKKFVPDGCVDNLLSKETVDCILGVTWLSRSEAKELVKFVLDTKKPAKKILIICVLSGFKDNALRDILRRFKKAEFFDTDLPVTESNRPKVPFLDHEHKSWVGMLSDNFENQQWKFLAPVFGDSAEKLKLAARHPFPFTDVKKCMGRGGYGVVHKATVHPAHMKNEAFSVSKHSRANIYN